MRRGKLTKEFNYLKNSYDWERYSRDNRNCWISVKAYLNAHDLKTFVGLVEGNLEGTLPNNTFAIKFDFQTIEEAFVWAEAQVDYKTCSISTNP